MANGSSNLRPGVAWTSNKALDAFQKTAAQSEQARQKREAQEFKAQEDVRKRAHKEATELSDIVPANIWEARDGEAIRSELNEGMKAMDGKWELLSKGDHDATKTFFNIKMDMGSMINKSAQDKKMYDKMSTVVTDPNKKMYDDEQMLFSKNAGVPLADIPLLNVRPEFDKALDSHIDQFLSEQKNSFSSSTKEDELTGVKKFSRKSEASEEDRQGSVESFVAKPGMRREIIERLGGLSAMNGKSPEKQNEMINRWAQENIYPRTEFKQSTYRKTGGVVTPTDVDTYDIANVTEQPVSYQFSIEGDDDEGSVREGSISGKRLQGIPFIDIQEATSGNRWDMATGNLIKQTHGEKGKVVDYVKMKVGATGTPNPNGSEERVFVIIQYGGGEGHTELTEIGNISNQLDKAGISSKELIGGKPKIEVSIADVDAKIKQYTP